MSGGRTPPRQLIDPEGEGVYFHADETGLLEAAWLFHGDRRAFREVESVFTPMREGADGCWYPTNAYWRLNAWCPRRWRAEPYVYYTPTPEPVSSAGGGK